MVIFHANDNSLPSMPMPDAAERFPSDSAHAFMPLCYRCHVFAFATKSAFTSAFSRQGCCGCFISTRQMLSASRRQRAACCRCQRQRRRCPPTGATAQAPAFDIEPRQV
jgi:hypothetical protein